MIELTNDQKNIIEDHAKEIKSDDWESFILDLYAKEIDSFDVSDILKFIYYDCSVDFLEYIDFIPSYMFAYSEIKNLDFLKKYKHINKIHSFAFEAANLEVVNIPDTINIIGDNAFCDCDKVKEIHLPKDLTFIGNYVFEGDLSIDKVYVPKNIKDLLYTSKTYYEIRDFNDAEFIEV